MKPRLLFCDTEYAVTPLGGVPKYMHCLAVVEGTSERAHWVGGGYLGACPEDFSGAIMVAWAAWAEVGSFLIAGFELPDRIIDVAGEFRIAINDDRVPKKLGLNDALRCLGIEPEYPDKQKKALQDLAASGVELSTAQREEMMEYCLSDARATKRIWDATQAIKLEEPYQSNRMVHAQIRGDYVKVLGKMMLRGVPVDGEMVKRIRENKATIASTVIRFAAERYPGVYDGERISEEGFGAYLRSLGLFDRWPRTDKTKRLAKDRDSFKEAARTHPELGLLVQAQATTSHLSRFGLTVDGDRNHVLPLPWSTKTGRANPTNTKFILSGPRWFRGLISPRDGYALLDCDFSQQEYLIGAAFSKDPLMLRRYAEGDVYLGFGKDAKQIPEHATKTTHPKARQRFKGAVLSIGFGVTEWGLRKRLKVSHERAKYILAQHRRTYERFWAWSDTVVADARAKGRVYTSLGWQYLVTNGTKDNTLRNFGAQAHGGEILRLSLIELDKAGYAICACNHDNVLIEVPLQELPHAKIEVPAIMARVAAAIIGPDHPMRVGVDVVLPGETMLPQDPDSLRLWKIVTRICETLQKPGNSLHVYTDACTYKQRMI